MLSDDHLAAEVAEKGRLSRLLAAADNESVSFAVDPALIEELQTMADGYAVLTGDGGTTPGSGQADAARWLEDFAELEDEHDGYRLLYGSPDLAALVHDKQRSVAKSAAAADRLVAATRDLPLLIMPTAGMADADTVAAASELDPVAIVLSDASARGPGPLLAGCDDDGSDRQPELHRTRRWTRTGPARHRRPGAAANPGRDLDRGQHRRPTKRPGAGSP